MAQVTLGATAQPACEFGPWLWNFAPPQTFYFS